MDKNFCGILLFQVKPDKTDEFEALITGVLSEHRQLTGCVDVKYMKRFYTFDEIGKLPRELTKIVKCVKYFSFWEFEDIDGYSKAMEWFMSNYGNRIQKLLIVPFDINSGYSIC
jgi:hypothetical protein